MTDIRSLRLALENKLNHRHDLIKDNMALARRVSHAEGELSEINRIVQNRMTGVALDDCADHIIKEILKHGTRASQLVAQECRDNGDYLVGINVPSLHIRHRILRAEIDLEIHRDAMAARDSVFVPINTKDDKEIAPVTPGPRN